jgi:hypothetical protein
MVVTASSYAPRTLRLQAWTVEQEPVPEGHTVLPHGANCELGLHESWLTVDVAEKRRTFARGVPEWIRVFNIPRSDIAGVEIEGLTEQHSRGWSVWTGFLGSGEQIPGTTGVMVTLDDGRYILFRVTGAPMEVRAQLLPLLLLNRPGLPPPAPPGMNR